MGSGGGSTVNTTPWSAQQPYLTQGYQQAGGLYQGGAGYNPYPGPTQAGLDPLQQQGMGMIQNTVLGKNNSVQAAEDMLKNTLQGKMGYTPSYLNGAMGQASAGVPAIQNAMNQSWMNQPYASQILGTSGGAYLGSNPFLDQVYNTAARKATEQFTQGIMPGIRAGAQGAGQGASSRNALAQGQAAGMQGQGLLDLAGQIYAPAYENERNRMLQAAGLGQQGYFGDVSNQLQGAGMLQNAQENYFNRMLNGAQLQSSLNDAERARQMQAAGLSPSFPTWGAQQLMGLGSINQNQQQNELNAMQNFWNQYQQSPWQRLGAYNQAIVGGGTPGGTQTTEGGNNTLLGGLGGAGMGAGIGGALPATFMAANPYMWPLLIGGGAIAGLM